MSPVKRLATRRASPISIPAYPLTVLAALLGLTAVRCAHMEPPSGGPIDTTPPVVAAVYPAPGARNVAADAPVVIQFSEWIDRNAARNQVFVSPPLRGRLRVAVEGNKLQVLPSEASGGWRANTSYQVVVLPGLQDLHAVKAGRAFKLRFSTGATFDSATLEGAVTSETGATRVAALYASGNRTGVEPLSARATDFVPAATPEPWRELPAFLAPADSAGFFQFDSVAQGDYALLVFEDVNGNFTYDYGFENAATGTLSLSLRPHGPAQSLRTVRADTLPLRIAAAEFLADSLLDTAGVSSGSARVAGRVRVEFTRPPHPVRARDAARYRLIPESGAAVAVTSAEWNPLIGAWILEVPPLAAARNYRIEMRDRPDYTGRAGAGVPDTSLAFTVGSARDTVEWDLSFTAVSPGTRLPRVLRAAAPGREYRVVSNRSLDPNRWKVLNERLEVLFDTLPAPRTISLVNNSTFSLKFLKAPYGVRQIFLSLRPGAGDSVPTRLGSVELFDTASTGTVRFTPPTRYAGWIFRLEAPDSTAYAFSQPGSVAEAALVPVGKYRLFGFQDSDRDSVWNPGAIKPWIPQEPHALILDSIEVKSGSPNDLTELLARPRINR